MVPIGDKVVCFYLLFLWLFLPMAHAADAVRGADEFHAPMKTMVIRDGRLDARINGVALGSVMESLAVQTGLVVSVAPSLLEKPVHVNFHGLSLEEGLKKIAAPYSYVLVFSSEGDEHSLFPVTAIRLYPKGEASDGPYATVANRTSRDEGNEESNHVALGTQDDLEVLLQLHDRMTRSQIARQTQERAQRKRAYHGLPETSIIQSSVKGLRATPKADRPMTQLPEARRTFSEWQMFHRQREKADLQRYLQRQQSEALSQPFSMRMRAP